MKNSGRWLLAAILSVLIQTGIANAQTPAHPQSADELQKTIVDLEREILLLKLKNRQMQAEQLRQEQLRQQQLPTQIPQANPQTFPPVQNQQFSAGNVGPQPINPIPSGPQSVLRTHTIVEPIIVEQPIYQVPRYIPNQFDYGYGVPSGFGFQRGIDISFGRFNLNIPVHPGQGHGNRKRRD